MKIINNSSVFPPPKSDREAIQFALNNVDPLEIPDFLQAWLDDEPLAHWLKPARDQSSPAQARPDLPALGDAAMSDAEMLALLKYPEIAMSFAVDHLQSVEAQNFIRDWKQGVDLAPWILIWRQSQRL